MKSCLLVLAICMFTSISQADYTINRFPIYVGSDHQTNPDIDGGMVVWQSSDKNIYWKLIGTEDPNVIVIGGEQTDPKVSSGIIVWIDKNGSDHDVDGFDTANQTDLFFMEDDGLTQLDPDISGNTVVYRASSDVYTHPIGGTSSPVAPASGSRYEFSIDGSIVAWMEMVDAPQIMVRDISTSDAPLQVTTGTDWHRNPAVSGRLIVWDEDSGDGTYDIYGYDLDDPATGVFPICTDVGSQKYPAVSGSIVVWQDQSDGTGSYDIWAIDLADAGSPAFEVSDGTGDNKNPAVSGNTIVWEKQGANWDIVAAELLTPSTVTVTSPNGGESIEAASLMTIEWTSTGPVADVLIEFSSDGGVTWTDVNTVSNTGSFLWDPIADVDSEDCSIRVTNVDNATATDTSDAVFEIFQIPNSITMITPDGSEEFLAGSAMDISWASFGPVADVKVEFSVNDGLDWQEVTATTPNDGAFTWAAVPADIDSTLCRIRISDVADITTKDVSGAFTVFQCDAALTADLTGDCYVDIADWAEMARQWLSCGNLYDPTWCTSQ